jgi:hypothetical protein
LQVAGFSTGRTRSCFLCHLDGAAEGSGTRLTLTHSGWERGVPDTARYEGYVTGWDFVLGKYIDGTRQPAV